MSSVKVTLLIVIITRNSSCSVGGEAGKSVLLGKGRREACLTQGFGRQTHGPFLHNWREKGLGKGSEGWGLGASEPCLHQELETLRLRGQALFPPPSRGGGTGPEVCGYSSASREAAGSGQIRESVGPG